jgi:hypothetical protein
MGLSEEFMLLKLSKSKRYDAGKPWRFYPVTRQKSVALKFAILNKLNGFVQNRIHIILVAVLALWHCNRSGSIMRLRAGQPCGRPQTVHVISGARMGGGREDRPLVFQHSAEGIHGYMRSRSPKAAAAEAENPIRQVGSGRTSILFSGPR